MKIQRLFLTFSLALTAFLSFQATAFAQPAPIEIQPVGGFASLQEALNTLIPVAAFIGGLLCFGYLLFGAYKYLTAGENASNVEAARKTIINAIIGLLLLGLVFIIFKVATEIIGIDSMFFGGGGGSGGVGGCSGQSCAIDR